MAKNIKHNQNPMLLSLVCYNIFSVGRRFKRFLILITSGFCFILKEKPKHVNTHIYVHIISSYC